MELQNIGGSQTVQEKLLFYCNYIVAAQRTSEEEPDSDSKLRNCQKTIAAE